MAAAADERTREENGEREREKSEEGIKARAAAKCYLVSHASNSITIRVGHASCAQ